ncbi:hypothetical protein OIV83_004957 [Microbotryomycetes sp. JL201]|nr:hypothetical protein OIV83_004957 [Microbotryomycetes sp. JL201]
MPQIKSLRRPSITANGLDTIDETPAQAPDTAPTQPHPRNSIDSMRGGVSVVPVSFALSGDPLTQYSPSKNLRSKTRPANSGGHVRGLSSISYSSSSSSIRDMASPASQQATAHGAGRARPQSMNTESGETSFMLGSPVTQRTSLDLRRSSANETSIQARPEPAATLDNAGSVAAISDDLFSVASAASSASDLLSFIAKKEQKCLELREELQRHEDDLSRLKRKWESIVSRSMKNKTQATSATNVPTLMTTANGGAALSNLENGDVASTDLTESVQAAKTWVGGVFGKVLTDSPWMRRSLSEASEADDGPEREDDQPAKVVPVTPSRPSLQENQQDPLSPLAALKRSSSSHGRTRSTFDVISNVAGGSWTTLGKKLSAVADTVEQGLASALGPIESENETASHLTTAAATTKLGAVNKMRPVRSRSSSQMSDIDRPPSTPRAASSENFDWTGKDDELDSFQNESKVGGYRRPSLTPKRQTRLQTNDRYSCRAELEQVDEAALTIDVDDMSKSWAAW